MPIERKKGTGVKTKYERNDVKDKITKIIKNNRRVTLNDIQIMLFDNHNIKYSKSNIHNIIKDDLKCVKKKATLEIPLTEDHLNSRQYWTIFYQHYNWNSIIWSDETNICNDSNSYQKIWFQPDEKIIKSKYKYPIKINLWGAIIKNNKLVFKIFNKKMNSDTYIEILKEKIIPTIKNKKYIYQQDNALYHASFKMLSFFSKNKIEVMYWPPCSPDINPVENIWNLVKNKVRQKHYNNKEEMINEVTEILLNFPIEQINKLIDSMDNRIEALYNNNFGTIDY